MTQSIFMFAKLCFTREWGIKPSALMERSHKKKTHSLACFKKLIYSPLCIKSKLGEEVMHIVILYQLKIPHKQAHIIRPLIIIFRPCILSPMNWKISASSGIHTIYRKIHTPKPLFGRKKRQNYRNINVFKTHSFTPSTLVCLKSQADFNMINKKTSIWV